MVRLPISEALFDVQIACLLLVGATFRAVLSQFDLHIVYLLGRLTFRLLTHRTMLLLFAVFYSGLIISLAMHSDLRAAEMAFAAARATVSAVLMLPLPLVAAMSRYVILRLTVLERKLTKVPCSKKDIDFLRAVSTEQMVMATVCFACSPSERTLFFNF